MRLIPIPTIQLERVKMNFLKTYLVPSLALFTKVIAINVADKYLKISDRVVSMLPAMK